MRNHWMVVSFLFVAALVVLPRIGRGQGKPENPVADLIERVEALEGQVHELQSRLIHYSREGDEVYLTGANLHIVSLPAPGARSGLGNLIIGHNEPRGDGSDERSGFHNLVLGTECNYTGRGGIVMGRRNSIGGIRSSILGGEQNTASGTDNVILAGRWNETIGRIGCIGAGISNEASGEGAVVLGGAGNTASGMWSTIAGGQTGTASGAISSISGGGFNAATETSAAVCGGSGNVASAPGSTVGGGRERVASGFYDWAAGSLYEDDVE